MAKNQTLKSKITLTNFRPARLLALPEDQFRLMLGTLVGRATGVVQRKSTDDEQVFEGLGGMFMAVVDKDEPIRSGVLFMPDSFIQPLIAMLSDEVNKKSGEVIRPGADAVEFAYNVWAVRSKNAVGREWELEAIMDPKAEEPVDPLANLTARLAPAVVVPQIESGKKEKAAK